MKNYSWFKYLREYDPEHDANYVIFGFDYPINKTSKAILFKAYGKSIWVPLTTIRKEYKDGQPYAVRIWKKILLSQFEEKTWK
ncbi:MAG: hypothetical protein ACW98X_25995 [Promethearchaeota archaeon]|jgi:hypothetical protein